MANFPALSKSPDVNITADYDDQTVEVPTESGAYFSRPRFTRDRRVWNVSYTGLTQTDKNTLDTFATSTVRLAAGAFNFTFPADGAKSVRFVKGKSPSFREVVKNVVGIYYSCSFQLREV